MEAANPDAEGSPRPAHRGDQLAAEQFVAAYEALHRLAERAMRNQPRGHTLQPTALLHEAAIKLIGGGARVRDSQHLRAVAARAMRQVLVDHARAKKSKKRDRDAPPPITPRITISVASRAANVLDLHQALEKLGAIDRNLQAVAELVAFGLTAEEVAAELDTSLRTVQRRWRAASAWLAQELK